MIVPVDSRAPLLPKPEPPDASECCGNGCDPCVYDIYAEKLAEWARRVEAIEVLQRTDGEQSQGPMIAGRGR
jgi:cytochrome-b5 reductase